MVVRDERHQSLQSYPYWIFYSHSSIDYWRRVPLNLRFCYRWQRVFSTKEEEKDISTPDEATTRDVSTIPVTRSMPSQEENVSGTVTA